MAIMQIGPEDRLRLDGGLLCKAVVRKEAGKTGMEVANIPAREGSSLIYTQNDENQYVMESQGTVRDNALPYSNW
ncbi:MAG: hypothetical protein QM627_01805 [Luteolibacter sp.]